MGYETTLYLIGVRIPPSRRAHGEKCLQKQREGKDEGLAGLCQVVDFDSDGFLQVVAKRAKKQGWYVDEVPDDEGFVLSLVGKCYGSEKFARWLCRSGFEGSIIQHSCEGDGRAWGWEFKTKRIRYWELRPAGPWAPVSVR